MFDSLNFRATFGADYTVMFGTTNLAEFSENAQSRTVSQVFIHPEFDAELLNFDVALLKLSSPLPITDHIRTICVPDTEVFGLGTQCYVTGWGSQEIGGNIYYKRTKNIFNSKINRRGNINEP